jgi:hypothetical protein
LDLRAALTIHPSGVLGSPERGATLTWRRNAQLQPVAVPALHVTPAAQALLAQETTHVEPLQVIALEHEFLAEQVIVLLLAKVLIPPEQEDPPLQVMPH